MSGPSDLDRLELELRSIPGVVAVGLDREPSSDALLVQVAVLQVLAPTDLRARVRSVVDANVREAVSLEILIDNLPSPAATAG